MTKTCSVERIEYSVDGNVHPDGGLIIHDDGNIMVVLFNGGGIPVGPGTPITKEILERNAKVYQIPGVKGITDGSAVASRFPDGSCSGKIVK